MCHNWVCYDCYRRCKRSFQSRQANVQLCASCTLQHLFCPAVHSKFAIRIDLQWGKSKFQMKPREGPSLTRDLNNQDINVPLSFSMTTKIRSLVSNICSRLTTPGWCRFCRMATYTKQIQPNYNLNEELVQHRQHVQHTQHVQHNTQQFQYNQHVQHTQCDEHSIILSILNMNSQRKKSSIIFAIQASLCHMLRPSVINLLTMFRILNIYNLLNKFSIILNNFRTSAHPI